MNNFKVKAVKVKLPGDLKSMGSGKHWDDMSLGWHLHDMQISLLDFET